MNHASRPCRWRNQPFQRKRPSTNEAVWTEEKMHSTCGWKFIVSFNQHLQGFLGQNATRKRARVRQVTPERSAISRCSACADIWRTERYRTFAPSSACTSAKPCGLASTRGVTTTHLNGRINLPRSHRFRWIQWSFNAYLAFPHQSAHGMRFSTPCSWGIFTDSVTQGTSVAHQSAWADCFPSFRGTGVSLQIAIDTANMRKFARSRWRWLPTL